MERVQIMAEATRELIACAVCGTRFVPFSSRTKVCSETCRKERQKRQMASWRQAHSPEPAKKRCAQTVADVLRYADKHKKKTGVYLSYGQAVAKMAQEGYRT